MSTYTTEIRFLIENGYDLGLNEYPIFNENYRAALNKKILDHYMFREIGLETPGRFVHYLKTRMNEIMPLYNKMYQSELLAFNPMYDHDITETSNKKTDGTASGKNQAASAGTVISVTDGTDGRTDTALAVSSNTPQAMITRPNLLGDIYASSAQRSENTDAGTTHSDGDTRSTNQDYTENSSTIKNTDEFLRHVAGNTGAKNFSELLNDYRSTFLNIDMQIINDLNDLFMSVYNVPDNYSAYAFRGYD